VTPYRSIALCAAMAFITGCSRTTERPAEVPPVGSGTATGLSDTPPTDAVGFHKRGETHFAQKRYTEAVSDFRRAVEMAPTPLIRNDYAVALDRTGRSAEALEQLDEAIKSDSKASVLFANRARLRAKLGKRAEAKVDADAMVALDPQFAQLYYIRGVVNYTCGDFEAAEKDFTRCLELDSAFVDAHHNRSVVRLEGVEAGRGNLTGALEDLEVLADRIPELRHLYLLNRGIVLYKAGRLAEAEQVFSTTLVTYPRYPDAYNNRAAVRSDRGDLDGAYQDLGVADQLAPGKYSNNLALIRRQLAARNSNFQAAIPVPSRGSPEPWLDNERTQFWLEFGTQAALCLLRDRSAGDHTRASDPLYRRVHVQGYQRADGTRVKEHYRYIPVKGP
jgi:tetratricopeptide (TPR) repeat protein